MLLGCTPAPPGPETVRRVIGSEDANDSPVHGRADRYIFLGGMIASEAEAPELLERRRLTKASMAEVLRKRLQ
jgi:hypothetical protein